MAVDVTTLTTRLGSLRKLRATGTRSYTYLSNGVQRQMVYRDDRELAAAIAALESEIESATGVSRPRSIVVRPTPMGGW